MPVAPPRQGQSHLRSGRSRASLVGLLWNLGNIATTSILAAVAFAFTSRVLGPGEFGAVALAMSLVMMAGTLVPVAFGDALIQRTDLRDTHMDGVFYVTMGIGLAAFAALVAAAPLAGRLTGQPIIAQILPVLALRLPFDALATVPTALITRRMDFRALAIRSVIASGLASALCIAMLLMGFALWALVVSQLAASVIASIVATLVAGWRPGRAISARALAELRSFGLFAMGGRVLNDARIDQFLLGIVLGPATLGLYFFARRIYQLLIDLTGGALMPVSNVLFASLQDEAEKRREAYLTASFGATLVSLPVFGGCLAVAPVAVPLIFGPQWTPAVFALQAFSAIGIMAGLGVIQSALIRNLGAPGWWFWYQAAGQGLNWLMIPLFAPWGINAIMAAIVLRTVLLWPLSIRKVQRMLDLGFADYARSLAAPVIAVAAMIPAVMLLPSVLPQMSAAGLLGLQVLIGMLVYLTLVAAIGYHQLRGIWLIVRNSRKTAP